MAQRKLPRSVQQHLSLSSSQRRQKIIRRLLSIWSELVLGLHGARCAWCQGGQMDKRIQAHHIVARRLANKAGWFDPRNGMPLCYRCHFDRIKSEPDEYIVMRDAWLRERGLSYETMRRIYSAKQRCTHETLLLFEYDLKTRVAKLRLRKEG